MQSTDGLRAHDNIYMVDGIVKRSLYGAEISATALLFRSPIASLNQGAGTIATRMADQFHCDPAKRTTVVPTGYARGFTLSGGRMI
jgi:hypothetical protein